MEDIKQVEDKRCPACGGTLASIYNDVYLSFDTPFRFVPEGLSMDVYACEKCGRLEFYHLGPVKADEPDPEDMMICPECGHEHSRYICCPHCLEQKGIQSALRYGTGMEQMERRKKNDVPWEF